MRELSSFSLVIDLLLLACLPVYLPACSRPLELHHTVLHGSRTFKCSLVFSPPSQGSSNSAELGHHQSHLVTVTVQEVGRRCVVLDQQRTDLSCTSFGASPIQQQAVLC